MSVLKEANATGRFWIGASDLEKVGHFKWFYNGNTISAAQWAQQGKPTDSEEALELDQVSIPSVVEVSNNRTRLFCKIVAKFSQSWCI